MDEAPEGILRRWLVYIGLALALLVLGYAIGRWAQPAKIVEKEKVVTRTEQVTQWRDRVVTKTQVRYVKAKAEVVDRVVTVYKDRTVTQEHIVEKDTTQAQTEKQSEKVASGAETARAETVAEKSKETTYPKPQWGLGATARFGKGTPTYGGELDHRFIGPIWLDASFDSGLQLGVGARLEF